MSEARAFHSNHVVTPQGVIAATVLAEAGAIAAIIPDRLAAGRDAELAPAERVELGDLLLLPGLVDTHVHVNEPGRTEWEGFETATRAAAAGGVTSLVDMPLNSIPATTTVAALNAKRAAARDKCHVDVAFWGGVVPGNTAELPGLAAEGVPGFKCFMVPSGVDEFAAVGEAELTEAMPVLARLGLPLLAHAESPEPIHVATRALAMSDPRTYANWLASRPPASEVEAIELLARLASRFGTRVHVVHVTSAEAVEAIRNAKARGVAITAETCPHYLAFAAEDIRDGATPFKCAPPIRTREHREALWAALLDGTLDLIASDHSPCPPELKKLEHGDFFAAWGGIASLELGLSAVWTTRPEGVTIEHIARWMSTAPARLAGLKSKGAIEVGRAADLVAFDPNAEWTVDARKLRQRHALTPYDGRNLRGRVECVWRAGEEISV